MLVGVAEREDEDPGRVFVIGPAHSFAQFADAINAAFARFDRSHLHEFELADGRKIGFPDDEFAPEVAWEDHAAVKVAGAVGPTDEFVFVFDFGEGWRHRCAVMAQKVDPRDFVGPDGPLPKAPLAVFGWGWIPDQYRRTTRDDGRLDDAA